jgi:Flp pilus assembly protein protease CpaA
MTYIMELLAVIIIYITVKTHLKKEVNIPNWIVLTLSFIYLVLLITKHVRP